ncbi:magnesium transporter NIPA-domain-containing protein [Morchella snyderi]|nr:magnesium transporter NIPA-domain-containing protein [Morchella snyderi]
MSETIAYLLARATTEAAAATSTTAAAGHGGLSSAGRPPVYKAVGVSLAVASGVFIGCSFVLKKKGLLDANMKDGKEAGDGYGYLRNGWWWSGMILMIIGEICNFCAYAFVEAILVTPLGALSVVITAILSSMFLNERLSFIGKIGCFMCIVGSIVIVINAPEQSSVSTIQDMKGFIISPGFLSYAGVVIVGCIGIVIWIAPKYGQKSMMVYISVCSLIGGLSVVATQGLGAAVVTQISGTPQFNQWFLYVLFVFIVITLVVEIIYLNKALNIFNAALVTPTYYVFFTSSTIVTSAVLFRGFKGTPSSIATVVMGFLQICAGVVLLQLSKSAKNVPDTEIFRGDLDQVRTVAEQSEPESEPKADAIRGTAAIIRRISVARQRMEQEEAKRIREERLKDMLSVPLHDGEMVEWDGVQRRVTWSGSSGDGPRRRNTTSGPHPPLGMSRMPDLEEGTEGELTPVVLNRRRSMSVDEAMRRQIYDIEAETEEIHPQSFVGRVRNLFVPRPRSKASLRDETDVVIAVTSPHRDITDQGLPSSSQGRAYGDLSAPLPLREFSGDYHHQIGPKASPQMTITPSEGEFSSRDFASESPPPLPEHGVKRTVDAGSDYTAIPPRAPRSAPGHINSPVVRPMLTPTTPHSAHSTDSGLRPDSADHTSRRQFSFQSVFGRHSRSHSRDSHGEGASDIPLPLPHAHSHLSHPHLPARLHGLRRKSISGIQDKSVAKTEEESLGLVKGDSRASTLDYDKETGRYIESDDSEEEREREMLRRKE